MSNFAHLHLHTRYSLLDGANKLEPLMARVVELGQPAVAMTDHGNMFGAVDFYTKAKKAGLKPILGCEVYVAPGDRRDRKKFDKNDPETGGGNSHLILLVKNAAGYSNLCRLVSLAYQEGFYYKPRIDHELLAQHSEGLICLSGCLSGELNKAIRAGSLDRARDTILFYRDTFGEDYYIEVQDNKLGIQEECNRELIALSREFSIPLVATNDCHYLHKDDAHSHEILLCVQTHAKISDERRFKLDTHELYVKSADEMRQAFAHCPEAVGNTLDVVNKCSFEMKLRDYKMPVFISTAWPSHWDSDQILASQANDGMHRLFGDSPALEYVSRLSYELDMIKRMGFAGYFLIVADIIRWAKAQDIPVGPGRGSVAGSLVAYCTGITGIDPLPLGLLFERFLNPERVSMPDIDMDFADDDRDKVIEYVREKYGHDKVANIITFGTLKGKAAIKDVGRALEYTFVETNELARLYPQPKHGIEYDLTTALSMEPKLQNWADSNAKNGELMQHALKLEGLLRHASKHAAGVVISPTPLIESVPLFVDREGTLLTQYDGKSIDEFGLVKFDFLGLKTLTLIKNTVANILRNGGAVPELDGMLTDDQEVYKLIASGDTVGVFQMESSGMRKMLLQLRPDCFEDITAANALYRPGPLDSGMVEEYIKRKHGEVEVTYMHPLLEPILKPTYGVIVYQEQVMQAVQVLANYTLAEADNVRRAMGKKDAALMAKEKARFAERAISNGLDGSLAEAIFNQIELFAAYGFNKSHSAAYSYIAYQTAYLKRYYRAEFIAALLTMDSDDTDKVYRDISDARKGGVKILPPDINESEGRFVATSAGVRFGFDAIKGLGEASSSAILAERANGPFASFGEFCQRNIGHINKKTVEALIRAGAFDSLGFSRASYMAQAKEMLAIAKSALKSKDSAQLGLFGATTFKLPEVKSLPEWDDSTLLEHEREVLGFYVSGHPLSAYDTDSLQVLDTQSLFGLDKQKVSVIGTVNALKLKNTKKGYRYASFVLEDMDGTVEVIVWPEKFEQYAYLLNQKEPLLITGILDSYEQHIQLIADTLRPLTLRRT